MAVLVREGAWLRTGQSVGNEKGGRVESHGMGKKIREEEWKDVGRRET